VSEESAIAETTRTPHADARQEARALLEEARSRAVVLRALGGLAVRLLCPSAARPPLERPYKDIDLIGLRDQRAAIDELLVNFGYEPDESFNLLSGHARLYYRDHENERELDVFLDRMDMCHSLELADRLDLSELTLTPTDMLLSKLQVYETNERDLKDATALLVDCEVDVGHVARTLANDWGWWRTVTEVLDKVSTYVASIDLPERPRVEAKIDELGAAIDAEPKGRRWRLRARVGDRMRWYELPEEDHAEEVP